ncbi:MAG: hypothetical protein WCC66_10905 [Rhizobiaceae bacterium]
MNTQSHVLMGALLFGRTVPRTAWAAALGGLAPDVPMLAIVAALRFSGYGFEDIFGRIYWSDWWQVANAIGHNFLLWTLTIVLCLYARNVSNQRAASWASLALPFAAAALLHSGIDFLVHRQDAHMHFWPMSQWRFVSPVSYWDRNHYGTMFSLFEAALGVAMAIGLFVRFRRRPVRVALAVCVTLYAAAPIFFIFGMSHG